MRIGIAGACGRMGKRIAAIAAADNEIELKLALEREGFPGLGKDFGSFLGTNNTGIIVTDDLETSCGDIDCLIDFTLPEPTMDHLNICADKGVAMVIGTTGLDASQENDIAERSRNIPIVFAPNMSIGVNLLFKIVKEAAGALSGDFDIRIDETHHIHKKDSPSGTAKMINKVIKEASGQDVPIKAFREGEVIGNHGIMFESEFETLEIRHNAKTRDVFAAGALKAAKFLKDKSSRLYTMADVLGIE